MSKGIYSEEELKQLIQNLFQEKKKVKELEQKLNYLEQEHQLLQAESKHLKSSSQAQKHNETEEIEKLKCLITTYKKKSAQAIHALYENEHQKIKQETTLAHQLRQLQSRIQELTEENAALLEQQKFLRIRYEQTDLVLKGIQQNSERGAVFKSPEAASLYQEALSQTLCQKEEIEKLKGILQEREKQINELQQFESALQKNNAHQLSLEIQLEKETHHNQKLQEENHRLSKISLDAQKHSEQLERVQKHLHDRSQEGHLELNQLRSEFQRSQEAIVHLTEQLQMAQKRLHACSHELNKVQSEKLEASEEIRLLQEQFSDLKLKIFEGQEALKATTKEKAQLEAHLVDKTHLFNRLESEIAAIKLALSKGLAESKDIQGKYLGIVNEKAALYHKADHLTQLMDQHHNELSHLQQQLEEAAKKEDIFKVQLEQHETAWQEKYQTSIKEMQNRLLGLESSLQKHHISLNEKEQEIERNNNRILQLTQEKLQLENTLSNVTRYQDEQDTRIKIAQQHVGKKLKEVALLNEKIENQQDQIIDLQTLLYQLQTKMADMESTYEQKLQQEKKLQEQLHETLRFSEGQVVKWEEKYLKTYEKLKVLEEKQQQMQTLFSSIGNVMGSQSMLPASSSPLSTTYPPHSFLSSKSPPQWEDLPQMHEESLAQGIQSLPSAQPSLFDAETIQQKFRQNLFD